MQGGRILVFAWLVLSACVCNAQVGVWGGRTYTPQSFPRASYCSCSMCQSLRAQWASYNARTQPAVQAVIQPVRTQQAKLQATTAYHTETRTEYVTQRVMVGKRCIGGVCYPIYQNRTFPITRTVRVPVPQLPDSAAPKPPEQASNGSEQQAVRPQNQPPAPDPLAISELVPTPQAVVDAMLRELNPGAGEKLFDLGSGDGRILVSAARDYGALAVGVEINSQSVELARQRAVAAGYDWSVLVLEGDAREVDLSEADCVTMYLYPELMKVLVPKMRRGTRIASYAHDIPGVESTRHVVDFAGTKHEIYTATIGGKQPVQLKSSPVASLTFGL